MTEINLIRTAFECGFVDGMYARKNITRRQAERKLAGLDDGYITSYLNGHDDGVKRDYTRYEMLRNDAR